MIENLIYFESVTERVFHVIPGTLTSVCVGLMSTRGFFSIPVLPFLDKNYISKGI